MRHRKVAVLFAQRNTYYRDFDCVDVYDADRDAYTFPGDMPIIAHPPCAHYSRMRGLATVREDNHPRHALWAVSQLRRYGGVLEQPACSTIKDICDLGEPMQVDLLWFGAPVRKPTWLWFFGCNPSPPPLQLGYPTRAVDSRRLRPVPKSQRSTTPPAMCEWLTDIARTAQPPR